MITDAIVTFVVGLLNEVLAFIPNFELPDMSGAAEAFMSALEYLSWANDYLPLLESFAFAVVLGGVFAVMAVVRFVLYVLVKSHLLGGR